MLRVHVEIVTDPRLSNRDLGTFLIGNLTTGMEDGDGCATYEWRYYPDGHTTRTPMETGRVERHRRGDGWEPLVAQVVADYAARRSGSATPGSPSS